MSTTLFYRTLRIEVRPSPETNEHEVRLFGDDDDIIARFWDDMIGLDPEAILAEPCQLRCDATPHFAIIARCCCGEIACGNVRVEVRRSQDFVEWMQIDSAADRPGRTFVFGTGSEGATIEIDRSGDKPGRILRFAATQYGTELERALNDTSWETPDRTAARLLAKQVDRDILACHGLTFGWASGRLRPETLSASLTLEPGPYQILVHVPWNSMTPEEVANRFGRMLAELPGLWTDVVWIPQRNNLGPPPIAGPTWQRFRS
jgi:hypothetical protein